MLLAEDHPVNQLLAKRIFRKLGHHVTVANNGREAVAAVKAGHFDLVAMDVQMPEMDGLAATIAIRSWEKTTGKHTPIIALTAHAMKGDRERCLEAGMDGYISKPIRGRELEQVISQVAGASSPKTMEKPSQPTATAKDSVLDRDALLAGIDGDRKLLHQLVRLFLADYPKRLQDISKAIQLGDAEALRAAAHALKGSVGNFFAKKAFAAAQQLELIGREGDFSAAGQASATLEAELRLVSDELKQLMGKPSARKRKTRRT